MPMARQNVTHDAGPATAEPTEPGRRLFDAVRGRFIGAGTSLNRWCLENEVSRHAAADCLTGASKGEEAQKLRARILRAAGLNGKE